MSPVMLMILALVGIYLVVSGKLNAVLNVLFG